jgi:Rha family phage regulatory protein
MNDTALMVQEREGVAVTTSRDVAERFGKEHKVVLRSVERLECSPSFREHNFVPSEYEGMTGIGRVRHYPMYYITRDGFTFLAMGFTGKKAAQWKEKYIAAFNAMERYIREQHEQTVVATSEDDFLKPELCSAHFYADHNIDG